MDQGRSRYYYLSYHARPTPEGLVDWSVSRYMTDASGAILDGPQPADRYQYGTAASHTAAALAAAAAVEKWQADDGR
jgi:hypothetical protein